MGVALKKRGKRVIFLIYPSHFLALSYLDCPLGTELGTETLGPMLLKFIPGEFPLWHSRNKSD